MLQRERWHTWRLCIQDQRFLQWLVEARNAFFFLIKRVQEYGNSLIINQVCLSLAFEQLF